MRSTLVRALALVLPLGLVPLAAPAAGAGASTGPDTYRNPLAPAVDGGGTVDSCADPLVLRGQQPGDDYWYLYCTTDPLNDEDVDANGDFVFHPVPQARSLDLVTWEYVGDALTQRPTWAEPTAGLWAPDVVYSSAFDQYYMFFVVTDTTSDLSGVESCTSDSAIGVAVSEGPTGPWTVSDQPVVGPRQAGDGCNFFWTYDPDVLGDAIEDESVLYYGSYYGGIFAQPLTLTVDGATVGGTATQVTIPNKYEGANVVERDGYYYLFVSATNCCAAELTGYSVYVGRSESPYGPFVDRDGVSLLAGRTGGTPVLSMNGNRWLGTGHNAVFQDAAGQWWTVYHAADRTDPVFPGTATPDNTGFTKRPALLDPVDWVDGWPTVRGGFWASDREMPAPAAQEGEQSGYRTVLAPVHVPGRTIGATDFDGDTLPARAEWIREPDPATYEVSDGVFRMQTQAADLHQTNNSASVLTVPASLERFMVETKVRLDLPPEGCCYNYVQAGLVVMADDESLSGDDNYLKLVHASIWETRQTEWAKESSRLPLREGAARYGNTVVGPPGEWTWLRIVREEAHPLHRLNGETEAYTAYTSLDGESWVRGGTWTHELGTDVRIGLVAMGGAGFTAEFDYVKVSGVQQRRLR